MPSIRDFSGGVLNQELQNRDNGNGVLFDCKNVLSSWNGELRKRTGTRWLKELEGNSKIIPYRLPNGDDMIMLLRDGEIKCYQFSDNAFVPFIAYTGSVDVPFPSSGWSSDTQGDWTVSGNSSYSSSAYGAMSDNYIYSQADFESERILFYQFENVNPVVFSRCHIHWKLQNINKGYAYRFGIAPVIQYSDDGFTWTPIQTDYTTPEYSAYPGGSHFGFNYLYTECSYDVSNNVYITAHKYWRIVFSQKDVRGEMYDNNIDRQPKLGVLNISFSSGGSATELVFSNCPYTNDDFDKIKYSQNGSTLTMACAGKQPYQIKIENNAFADAVFTPSDIALWDLYGYPSCVTYYQNRLWFGGFGTFPTRVCASEFGKFDKFSIPSPITSTSPIMADGTEISNVIENMWGGVNALYCLSEDGISMIDAKGAIVATDQVEFKLRNREPVDAMVPTVKDDIMIYLGRDKRKILMTDYDFVVQRFKANCISDNYNDFFKSGIKELHYIPRKSSLIYGVLEDGQWFALLFDIVKNKNSIYPFEISGKIIVVQPVKYSNKTKLLILTKLPSNQYIIEEKISQPDQEIMDFMSKTEKQQYTKEILESSDCYLDHSIKLVFDSPTFIISDLPYVSGENIEVIADGQYLGTKTTQLNENTGKVYISLDCAAKCVILGYKYDSYAVLKLVSPYMMRKFPKEISVNFINSGYLEVGNTFNSLKSVLNNLVESVNISNERIFMNGNYTKTLDKQAFETPYVIVRSDKGLPFIITGIDYKVDMSNYQGGI